ncbi:MAG: glycosyltransferase family 4 protein [bacterium]|nr:glycosyltransferase family 4 protein [bacterium]
MKIILVNTKHFPGGGDSTYTFNLARLLREKGHEVAHFAMQDPKNIPDVNSDLFVSYIDFKELNRRKNLSSGLKTLGRAIYSREARRNFGHLLDRIQPDIVHLQGIHAHITPSVIFETKSRGLPVVWTLHDYKLICPNTHFLIDGSGKICESCGRWSFWPAIVKRCKKNSLLASSMAVLETYIHRLIGVWNRVDFFLSPSAFLKDKLVRRGLPASRIEHLPLFLPDELFLDERGDEGYLLFMGRLDPIKGIYPLLKAAHLATKTRLVLAGRAEGSVADQLTGLLPPNAQYVGMKQGVELRRLLSRARAVVLPSLWYENQPFSLTEAFAAAKPAIVSDLGGMTELVTKSQGGILVPPGDVDALAKAMDWMSLHPDDAREMGQKAQKYALCVHSANVHYRKLMEIYQLSIKGK